MPLQRGDDLGDHWFPRPGWTPTSRYLTWHLLPGDAPALHAVVTAQQEALRRVDGVVR